MKKLLKKVIKKIGILYKNILFRIFENNIQKDTWQQHGDIQNLANDMSKLDMQKLENDCLNSDEPIVKKGFELRQKVLKEFKDKYKKEVGIRILVHLPSKSISPGGYSLFKNLSDSLSFLGIPTKTILVGENISNTFETFLPTVFISSDDKSYLDKINWQYIKKYREDHDLKIGLTASIEAYGNTSLKDRLDWAKKHNIDFYYSFRSKEYLNNRIDYKPFFEYGYKIITVEFGANPLLYFPLPNIKKDINFVFLASSNADKQKRYFEWLPNIVNKYSGFIDGPGWNKISNWSSQPTHKYLYARAKIGINLHIDDSINWASELNERTYILAACGVSQLVDNAKLLDDRFSDKSVFKAKDPIEYSKIFKYMLDNPRECDKRALCALEEVFDRHTTFHRAEKFIVELKKSKEKL